MSQTRRVVSVNSERESLSSIFSRQFPLPLSLTDKFPFQADLMASYIYLVVGGIAWLRERERSLLHMNEGYTQRKYEFLIPFAQWLSYPFHCLSSLARSSPVLVGLNFFIFGCVFLAELLASLSLSVLSSQNQARGKWKSSSSLFPSPEQTENGFFSLFLRASKDAGMKLTIGRGSQGNI